MLSALLLLVLPAQFPATVPDDSIAKLRGQARSAEARFERVSRNLAPYTFGGPSGQACDEIVGRFCLTFDSTTPPPSSEEAGRVVDARREAVEAFRRFFSVAPGELRAAGPLIRLLVQDGRSPEAVSAARTFAALSSDSTWANLLLGLALHAAGQEADAERRFVTALHGMPAPQRRAWADPRWLLEQRERSALRRLSPDGRADYERRFWLASDPFWLTAPNEAWIEHIARYAEARLLEDVPLVPGMLRWGDDLDELTVRYGTPTARGRVPNRFGHEDSMVEYFDTASREYAPSQWITRGFPEPPAPGTKPLLYAARARSGYALRTVRRVLHLPHQLTRFLQGGDIVWRVDGALAAPDSLPVSAVTTGLFVYDSAFTRRVDRIEAVRWQRDTTRVTLTVQAPPGRAIYSVEALDTAGDYGARARYSLETLVPQDGPVLSDLLICAAFPQGGLPDQRGDARLRAHSSLIFSAGDTIGVYAEAYRLGAAGARVEIGLEPATGPGPVTRLARWLGRSLGLVGPPTDPRVAWRTAEEAGLRTLALNLPLDTRRRGHFVLVLKITDAASGRTTESRRPLLIR